MQGVDLESEVVLVSEAVGLALQGLDLVVGAGCHACIAQQGKHEEVGVLLMDAERTCATAFRSQIRQHQRSPRHAHPAARCEHGTRHGTRHPAPGFTECTVVD